ncbi:hypothetical protein J7J23_02140, partial [bacterium]|nr:hypothetical protein [bacterium]
LFQRKLLMIKNSKSLLILHFSFSFFIFRCLARSPAFSGATRQSGIASSVASLLPRNDRGKVYQRDPDSLVEIINSKF